jgi:catalase
MQGIRAETDQSQKGRLLRGVHPKSHGCVKAEFVVRDDIEKKYQVGLFAHPGKAYEAWIRFSNASVLREDDLQANRDGIRQHGSRGMAIKIMDVKGKMLSKEDGERNQDFLMINTPEFAFANVRDYLRLDRILERDPLGADPGPYFIPAVLAQLGPPVDGEPPEVTGKRKFLQSIVAKDPLLNKLSADDLKGTFASAKVAANISKQTVRNPMQVQYFGAAPFLFGEGRAMKFSVVPSVATKQEKFDPITADNPTKDYLKEALIQTMKGDQYVRFDFKIQVRSVDDDNLNIEDATTTWPNESTSYVNVARITVKAPQSPETEKAIEHCEKLVFSPWHSLADHQPLGGINRLRREVYSSSATHRGASDEDRRGRRKDR